MAFRVVIILKHITLEYITNIKGDHAHKYDSFVK